MRDTDISTTTIKRQLNNHHQNPHTHPPTTCARTCVGIVPVYSALLQLMLVVDVGSVVGNGSPIVMVAHALNTSARISIVEALLVLRATAWWCECGKGEVSLG